MSESVQFTVHGQPPSKSNSYKIITLPNYRSKKTGKQIKSHSSLGKTPELKKYEEMFLMQIPARYRGMMIDKVFHCDIKFYFRSMSSDLDNAWKCTLDCLQSGKVIKNDNKMIEQVGYKFIDKEEPRLELMIRTLGL